MQRTLELAALRLTQRFHVQLTALYTLAVLLLVVVPMGGAFYVVAVRAQMEGLQARLLVAAASLAAPIDGSTVLTFTSPEHVRTPAYKRLQRTLAAASAVDPSIYSIYILVPTDDPGVMRYALDFESARSLAGESDVPNPLVGMDYDVARFPTLLEGLRHPAVEHTLAFDDWRWTISGYAPIKDAAGTPVAVLGVDIDGQSVRRIRRHVMALTLGISGVGILLFALGGVLVGRSIRAPLEKLILATGRVARGDLSAGVAMARLDEFGVVGGHFDAMVQGLRDRQHIRATFGRYVSEEVAQALLADRDSAALGGEERHVTVLFSDLRGYSTISEHLEPTEVMDLLNRYFGAMHEVLERHGGVVIELLGDAILAVFGAPLDLDDHAAHAVRCALEMRERLAQLNVEWEHDGQAQCWQAVGLDALGHRIGIHTGNVVAGNLGSEERTKYAVIGKTVNLAARLEQLNKEVDGEGILLSSDTVAELPDALRERCVRRGERAVKGHEAPVELYSI